MVIAMIGICVPTFFMGPFIGFNFLTQSRIITCIWSNTIWRQIFAIPNIRICRRCHIASWREGNNSLNHNLPELLEPRPWLRMVVIKHAM